jgi:hypothetical protein
MCLPAAHPGPLPCMCLPWGHRRIGGAPKARIIPAQPNGLGNRTGDAKALKARSISIPTRTLIEFDPRLGNDSRYSSSKLRERFAGGMLNRHPALNDFGNWAAPLALGLYFGTLDLTWGVARALPQAGMGRAFGPRHSVRGTYDASAREKTPSFTAPPLAALLVAARRV